MRKPQPPPTVDLAARLEQGFLAKASSGRGFAWTPVEDLEQRLRTDTPGRLRKQAG